MEDGDDVAEDEVEDNNFEDDDVKGEENDEVENDDVEEEERDDVEEDDVEEEDRSQDRDPHFVRACADQLEQPGQAPAFAITLRILQCGHTVWGKTPNPKANLHPSSYSIRDGSIQKTTGDLGSNPGI